MFQLTQKVALITGAAGGIGTAIAHSYISAGARVVLADRSWSAVQELVEVLNAGQSIPVASGVALDVCDEAQCQAAVAHALSEFGGLDILVNNAGVNTRMRPELYSEALWDQIVDINLKGCFLMAKAAHPALQQSSGARIINIGSILSLVSNEMTAAYSASKGGVLQLTRALACAWAKDGINVNAILPGWIDTPLSRQARIDIPGHSERVVATTPMGRWGEPTDLVGPAVFLASPAAIFVNGAYLTVDGGVTAHA